MNAIISQKYLNFVDGKFTFEVLYDPYFGYALKLNILSKIKQIDLEMIGRLREIGKIRNIFAHYQPNYVVKTDFKKEEIAIDPKKLGEKIDFEERYTKFKRLADKVEKYLWEFFKELGGKVADKPF